MKMTLEEEEKIDAAMEKMLPFLAASNWSASSHRTGSTWRKGPHLHPPCFDFIMTRAQQQVFRGALLSFVIVFPKFWQAR